MSNNIAFLICVKDILTSIFNNGIYLKITVLWNFKLENVKDENLQQANAKDKWNENMIQKTWFCLSKTTSRIQRKSLNK